MNYLKFRALDKNKGKLEYGSLYFAALAHNSPRYSKIMMFAGAIDKNLREVYEGDKVKMLCGCIGVVERCGTAFIINIENIGNEKERHSRVWHNSFCGAFPWGTNCKVVGNIHNDAPDA